MQVNWESTHAHARALLESTAPDQEPAAQADALRRYLRLEGERLRMRHRCGLPGAEVAAGRSHLIDVLVRHVCRRAERAAGLRGEGTHAVVALGGYARGELAPFSDIDLLFLHDGASPEVSRFAERVLAALWDAGLSVGHSFRSPRESVAAARQDLHSRTALAEARLVTGSAPLFQKLLRLMEALRQDGPRTQSFAEELRRDILERREKHGQTVCVAEPNLKDGLGGLRDFHAVAWLAAARFGARGLEGLRNGGWVSEGARACARRAYDFLLRLRHEAHFVSGRKTDVLAFDLQAEIAQGLGYRGKAGLLASELLMRDFYVRASQLHRLSERFWLMHSEPRLRLLGPFGRPRGLRGGGRAILGAFAAAQARGVALSEEARDAIREHAQSVDRGFRGSGEAGRLLLQLLRRRGRVGPTLRDMHASGVLGRLLPEFGRITFLIQHDLFHRYTIDEHTLKAIEALDAVPAGREPGLEPLRRAFEALDDCAPLYLGMLLHDVGKGLGGGHVEKGVREARRALERLCIEREVAEKALFLVGAHLAMSETSQQRDLSEPGLIDAFAERVGTLERLDLLLLLTYADHRGVGPGIWTEWKAALLFELYGRVRERLVAGRHASDVAAQGPRDAAAAALREEFPADEVDRHFAMLPERYLRSTDAVRMAHHFRLARARPLDQAAVAWWDNGGPWSELTLVGSDRPGLIAALAGTLTAHGVDILSAEVFTRADGIAIDSFRVCELAAAHRALRPERQRRIGAALVEAAAGRHDVGEAVRCWRARLRRRTRRAVGRAARPPAVRFDQSASALATAVEVRALDQPGLAYTIAHTLAELRLDVSFARVATAKALAVDVFYVRDADGRKLDAVAERRVEAALLEALTPMKEVG